MLRLQSTRCTSRKEFDYDLLEDKINISPSKEGVLFSEYQDLINQLYI